MLNYKLLVIIAVFLLCTISSNANITRGTEYDEIYLSLPWFGDFDGVDYVILHSVNNGESVSLKYTSRYPAQENEMPIGYLVSDATPGYFYNYPWNEGPYGLWVTLDYGVNWYHIDQTSSRSSYKAGALGGEIYKFFQGSFISSDYGFSFTPITIVDTIYISDCGLVSGELYGRTGGIYNSDLSIYRSTDYGATYTLQSHFEAFELGNAYKTMIRGAEEGEIYLIMYNSFGQYNIYYSNDYGQSFQLQHQTNIQDIGDWDISFSAGTRPGSFYIMVNRPDNDLIYTFLKIFNSSNYGQTFTEYFHHLDEDLPLPVVLSSFTAIQTLENYAQLTWITQSETNLIGFNIYRSYENSFENSMKINDSIIDGNNTTTEQTYIFTDYQTTIGEAYYYWIECVNLDGSNELYGSVTCTIEESIVPELPQKTVLKNAYPNPFNPETKIEFSVKENDIAEFTIYNAKGQIIKSFSEFKAGDYLINWYGKDNQGNYVSSGIYLYELKSLTCKEIKKMLLIK
jgi:hypothetical protein